MSKIVETTARKYKIRKHEYKVKIGLRTEKKREKKSPYHDVISAYRNWLKQNNSSYTN